MPRHDTFLVFELRARRRVFSLFATVLPFSLVKFAGPAPYPSARPATDHDAETYSELQNPAEPKQFSTALQPIKLIDSVTLRQDNG